MKNKNLRNTAAALGAALALAAGSAQAYTPNKVNLAVDSFVDVTTTGMFSFGADLFHFTLSSASDVVFSLSSLAGSDITFAEVDLEKKYKGYRGDVFESGWMGATGHSTYSLSLNDLAPGKYTLKVWGFTTSLGYSLPGDTGSYRVALTSPVPEPGEWAMVLAGLGMVGFMARRRSRAL